MSKGLAEQIGRYTGRRYKRLVKRLSSKKRRRRMRDPEASTQNRYRGYTD